MALTEWSRKDTSLLGLYVKQTWIVSGAKRKVAVYVGRRQKIADGIGTFLLFLFLVPFSCFIFWIGASIWECKIEGNCYFGDADPHNELRISEIQSFWVAERLMKENLLNSNNLNAEYLGKLIRSGDAFESAV